MEMYCFLPTAHVYLSPNNMSGSLSKQSLHLKNGAKTKRRRLVADEDFTSDGTLSLLTTQNLQLPYKEGDVLTFVGSKWTNSSKATVEVSISRTLWLINDEAVPLAAVTVSSDKTLRIRCVRPVNQDTRIPARLQLTINKPATTRKVTIMVNGTGQLTYWVGTNDTTLTAYVHAAAFVASVLCDVVVRVVSDSIVLTSASLLYTPLTSFPVPTLPALTPAIELVKAAVSVDQPAGMIGLKFKPFDATFYSNYFEPVIDSSGFYYLGFRARTAMSNIRIDTSSCGVRWQNGAATQTDTINHTVVVVRNASSELTNQSVAGSGAVSNTVTLAEGDYVHVTFTGYISPLFSPVYEGQITFTST
jgi:hypothetical protein